MARGNGRFIALLAAVLLLLGTAAIVLSDGSSFGGIGRDIRGAVDDAVEDVSDAVADAIDDIYDAVADAREELGEAAEETE